MDFDNQMGIAKASSALMVKFFLILLMFLVSQLACDKGVEPSIAVKNPRDYSWTIDTLVVPGEFQTMLNGIWGTSPDNIYVVGGNSGFRETIFHFDGKRWTAIFPLGDVPDYDNGGRSFDLESIIGFSSNNIWISGSEVYYNKTPPPNYLDSSVVFHYNGSSWIRQKLPAREGTVFNLWGDRPDNIWATGGRALWHFDGQTWSRDSIPSFVPEGRIGSLVQSADGSTYCIIYGHNNSPYYLLKRTSSWALLDSARETDSRWGIYRLWISPEGSLFSLGNGVFRRFPPETWTRMFDTFPNPVVAMNGHDEDFFAVGTFGVFFYYDRSGVLENHQFEATNSAQTSLWRSNDQVFICGYIVGPSPETKAIIIRGK